MLRQNCALNMFSIMHTVMYNMYSRVGSIHIIRLLNVRKGSNSNVCTSCIIEELILICSSEYNIMCLLERLSVYAISSTSTREMVYSSCCINNVQMQFIEFKLIFINVCTTSS